jgi:murein DD-endopeptidase MepM/ murein hydrolase activator NlpD
MSLFNKLLERSLQVRHAFANVRRSRIASSAALCLAVFAFGAAGVAPIAPDAADLPVTSLVEELSLPTLAEQVAALDPSTQNYISEERMRPGDTLAALMGRLGVHDDAALSFIKSDRVASSLLQLKPGRRVQAKIAADGELQWLSTTLTEGRDSQVKNLVISRQGETFNAAETPTAVERRIEMRTGEIRSSLFAATDAADIPDAIAMQLVDMFSTNIDFASDLRRGDRFNVVYETFWQTGDYVRTGRVLAAEFHNGSATYQSVWFDDPASKRGGGYYGFDGKSLKKAFLKSPIEFSRVSSGFAMRRHPISGAWKQHKGVDFAAVTGTPIRAAADGTIQFIGKQGGYGNFIILKHWDKYTTAYAHMSRFASGLRNGAKVNQGEVIGYVGSTGWSTGPHLHYEFRVNNQSRDPMAIDVPNVQPLAGAELQRFRQVANDMTHRFALLSPSDTNLKLASK